MDPEDEVLTGSSSGAAGNLVSSRCALRVSSGCAVETSWVGPSIVNKITAQKKTALAKYIPEPKQEDCKHKEHGHRVVG